MSAHVLVAAGTALLAFQLTQAHVTGLVTDAASGQPVAGAVVQLLELERRMVTDVLGRYRFYNVPPGPQHLAVTALAYDERNLHVFVPRRGTLTVDLSLNARPLRLPSLEVRPPPLVKGVDAHEAAFALDARLSSSAVRNHPLLAEPDGLQALHGSGVFLQPEQPAGVHIRGGASDQTLFLLDGIPVFNPYHAAGLFSAWNPDAIAELEISAAAPSAGAPEALAGIVHGRTRRARARHSVQGSLSTTQARATFDGPLGGTGGGYLIAARTGLHDLLAPRDEPSYMRSETADWLGKVQLPFLRGELSLLGYEAENEIDFAAAANSTDFGRRNAVQWSSQSVGARWSGAVHSTQIEMLAWHARTNSSADWRAQSMNSGRRDVGVSGSLQHGETRLGARLAVPSSSYRTDSLSLNQRIVISTVFAERTFHPVATVEWRVGLGLTHAVQRWHPTPRLHLRWQATPQLALLTGYARTTQFTQSLRNHESVVGTVFPAELPIVSDGARVPVAEGDQLLVGAQLRPVPGLHLTGQLYARSFRNVVQAAPVSAEPFSISRFAVGGGRAYGVAIDGTFQSAGYAALLSYGWRQTRLRYAETAYVPQHAAAHSAEAGLVAFLGRTWTVKVGAAGVLGRRGTPLLGLVEWESCNLLDRGCEFAGQPAQDSSALGGSRLPWYARVDGGVRKHWHVQLAGRSATIAVFGTITNVTGRQNVLTYSREDGATQAVGMRPRSVLLAGIDWNW